MGSANDSFFSFPVGDRLILFDSGDDFYWLAGFTVNDFIDGTHTGGYSGQLSQYASRDDNPFSSKS